MFVASALRCRYSAETIERKIAELGAVLGVAISVAGRGRGDGDLLDGGLDLAAQRRRHLAVEQQQVQAVEQGSRAASRRGAGDGDLLG